MKKRFSLFLVLCLIVSVCNITAYAESTTTFKTERSSVMLTKVEALLMNEGNNLAINAPIALYNLSNTIEAYCYPLSPSGYVIVSYKTGSIIEYSPSAPCPVPAEGGNMIYYNGVLQYYRKDGPNYIHTITAEQHPISSLSEGLNEPFVTSIDVSVANKQRQVNAAYYVSEPDESIGARTENGQTWYCGITAATILLDWYQDNTTGSFYPYGVTTITGMRQFLFENNYLPNTGISLPQMKQGNSSTYDGLDAYFALLSVSNKTATVVRNSYSNVYSQIATYHRPAILLIPTNLITPSSSGNHFVIVYGIDEISGENDMYYVVNDCYGQNDANDVWLNNTYVPTGDNRLLYLA